MVSKCSEAEFLAGAWYGRGTALPIEGYTKTVAANKKKSAHK